MQQCLCMNTLHGLRSLHVWNTKTHYHMKWCSARVFCMPVFALALTGRSHSCRVRGPEMCMSVFTLALQGRSHRTRVRGPETAHRKKRKKNRINQMKTCPLCIRSALYQTLLLGERQCILLLGNLTYYQNCCVKTHWCSHKVYTKTHCCLHRVCIETHCCVHKVGNKNRHMVSCKKKEDDIMSCHVMSCHVMSKTELIKWKHAHYV